jgi:signal transduction histidine kinase
MRRDQLAVVGHELRSPLAALLVSAELVADGLDELDQRQLGRMLETIQQRARALQVLVDNLMLSAAGQFSLRCEPLESTELVADVRLTVDPLLARKRQYLVVGGAHVTLTADRARLTQVLVNLILNASKFSPPQSVIHLDFNTRNGRVQVEVTDRGIGLPPGSTEWLFEPAARADHGVAGLGLGLAIVRSIVEAHGGRVGATNRADGGACFWFSLPCEQQQRRTA